VILLGVRIKTISGDTGTVTGVTYKDITLSGITDYGIVVRQDVSKSECNPIRPILEVSENPMLTFTSLQYDGTTGDPTNGITISDFVLDNVSGTVESSATNIWIFCGSGSCTDWTWTDVSVTGGKHPATGLGLT
jgi:polygalacturonase